MTRYDVAIVGAGMAGAGLAAALGGEARLLLLEAEDRPGYHSTGRSAAFWSESYGGPLIQPLTSASREALRPYLRPRGCIHLADAAGESALAALAAEFAGSAVSLVPIRRPELEARIPGLKAGWDHGLSEPTCADIDVAALHAAALRAATADLVVAARLTGAERSGGRWHLTTSAGTFEADILVNAAGAWADEVASLAGERPLGIRPCRRTIVQLRVDPAAPADLPLIVDAQGRYYFKPEAGGRLWLSPHDETACSPCDAAAEELDVAVAIDRLEQVVDWRIDAVEHKWAGLRSFAPDRLPVYGFGASGNGFFWCAGQGGFGIQTAPAASALAAALLRGSPDGEVDPAPYAATRFDRV
jgi:D-arginine dehydrogenase